MQDKEQDFELTPSETAEHSSIHEKENNLLTLHTIYVVSKEEEFAALRDEWNKINDHSPKGTIFISWEWLYTWWEVYKNEGKRSLYILTCRDHHGKLLGIAPFQIIKNPKRYFPCSRQLVFLGTGETDGSAIFGEYMDLLIEPGHETSLINTFSEFLFENRSLWDGLKFHQLLDDSYLSRLFKNQSDQIVKDIHPYGVRTIIDLPETYKDYLMSLQKKMRNNITRTFKRLESEQNFSLEQLVNLQDVDQSVSILANLNRGRQSELNQSSVFRNRNFESFHYKIVKRLLPLDKIRLRILRFNNEPVAALYSFVDRDTLQVYQSGFEKEPGHRYSLLTMMLTQEISKSIEDKQLAYFNFMFSEDDTTYKKRYSSKTETMYNLSYDKKGIRFKLYSMIHGPIKSLLKKILRPHK